MVAVHLAPPPSRQVWEWATPEFRVSSGGARRCRAWTVRPSPLDPPLVFESLPSALRARTNDQAHRGKNRGGWLGTTLLVSMRTEFPWPMTSAFALAPGEALVAAGKAARLRAPLEAHGEFSRSASRDPIGLILSQAGSRVPELVPVRHGRMLVSPLTYFRGAALPMAADLAGTPSSGLAVQLCGDAHLSNFGVFGSPERRVVFDLNDFDETLPGPFEWDVKRLVTSFAIAGRENGFPAKVRRAVTLATGAAYRTAMREFASMPVLDVWYSRLDVEAVLAELRSEMPRKAVRQTEAHLAKARARDGTRAVAKLTKVVDGQHRIVSDPPLIVPIEELAGDIDVDEIYRFIDALVLEYTKTLPADRRRLAERFKLSRLARKVVGVGSVGTETWPC